MDKEVKDSLLRLLEVAYSDTGQSRRVAAFLLAWWNADTCGGFDLTDMWGLDLSLRQDILVVFGYIAFEQHYPDTLGWSHEFGRVLRGWRPHLIEPSSTNQSEARVEDPEIEESREEDCWFEIKCAPQPADQQDPDVVLNEMRLAAEQGNAEASEFLELLARWEVKFGAKLVDPKR